MGLKSGFGLLHRTDFRKVRPRVKVPGEAVELGFGSDGIGLHATIIFVTNPTGDADFACTVYDEPTETDTLDATVHKPAASDGRFLASQMASLASKKTAARDPDRPLRVNSGIPSAQMHAKEFWRLAGSGSFPASTPASASS